MERQRNLIRQFQIVGYGSYNQGCAINIQDVQNTYIAEENNLLLCLLTTLLVIKNKLFLHWEFYCKIDCFGEKASIKANASITIKMILLSFSAHYCYLIVDILNIRLHLPNLQVKHNGCFVLQVGNKVRMIVSDTRNRQCIMRWGRKQFKSCNQHSQCI